MTYETIYTNFVRRLWNWKMVKVALDKGIISGEQYKAIMDDGLELGILNEDTYNQASK